MGALSDVDECEFGADRKNCIKGDSRKAKAPVRPLFILTPTLHSNLLLALLILFSGFIFFVDFHPLLSSMGNPHTQVYADGCRTDHRVSTEVV